MSRILLICSHLVGRTRAAGELANRLVAQEHHVVLACSARVMDHLAHCKARRVEIPACKLGGPRPDKRAALTDYLPVYRRQRLLKLEQDLKLTSVETLIETEAPDLAIIDFELHPHIIVALGMNIKVALLTTMFITPPGPNTPPLDTTLMPGTASGAQVWWAWLRLWGRLRRLQRKQWRHSAGTDYLSLLRFLAVRRQVPLGQLSTRWWWQIPLAWNGLPLIILHSRALDFPHPPHPKLLHVGPVLQSKSSLSAEETEILERARMAKRQGKKVVYIGFGSMLAPDVKTLEAVWSAIASCDDLWAIQSTGRKSVSGTGDPPKNLHLVNWAPQTALLEVADAAIIHSGVNSLVECVAAATPMLSFQTFRDSGGNNARLVYHGLGKALPLSAPDRDIHSALRDLLDDPNYLQRCVAMQRHLKRDEDANTAVSSVAEILSQAEVKSRH